MPYGQQEGIAQGHVNRKSFYPNYTTIKGREKNRSIIKIKRSIIKNSDIHSGIVRYYNAK
ncbi:MAG TPA: hypothetical protein VIY08_06965 [Candidatus Nitrosocosmicus sp.]